TRIRQAPEALPASLPSSFSRVLRQSTNVDEMSGDRGRSGHRGTHQMRPTARTLATLEIAVRRRSTAFTRLEPVVVHREAHRAARLAPFEARVAKRAVEAFGFRLRLHESRTGHDHREPDIVGDPAAARHARRFPQVLDPRVRARPDED